MNFALSDEKSICSSKRHVCEIAHPQKQPIEPRPDSFPREFITVNKLGAVVNENAPENISDSNFENTTYNALKSLTTVLEERDIKYAVIKSFLPVPKEIGDIDILVDDLSQAATILESDGFKRENNDDPYKLKYNKTTSSGRVSIHLHGEITWHGQIYINKNDVLQNTVNKEHSHGEVVVPSPNYEALILAAHMLFETGNNRVIVLDALEYWSWSQNGKIDSELMLSIANRHNWGFGLRYYIGAVVAVYEKIYKENFNKLRNIDIPDVNMTFNPVYDAYVFDILQMSRIRIDRISELYSSTNTINIGEPVGVYLRNILDELAGRYGITYSKKRFNMMLEQTLGTAQFNESGQ